VPRHLRQARALAATRRLGNEVSDCLHCALPPRARRIQTENESEHQIIANEIKQTKSINQQIKKSNKIVKRCSGSNKNLFGGCFCFKGSPLPLLPKIAENITPRDQCESSFWNSAWAGCQGPSRCRLTAKPSEAF
jgi:hypothetical protein